MLWKFVRGRTRIPNARPTRLRRLGATALERDAAQFFFDQAFEGWARPTPAEDVATAQTLFTQFLLPRCLAETPDEDRLELIAQSRYRERMISWLDAYAPSIRAALRDSVLDDIRVVHHDESASLATDHQIALSYVAVDFPSTSGAPADRQDLEGQAARGGSQREGLGTSCRDRLADLVPKPAPLSPWEKRAQLRRQFGLDP